jgi:hypoxanthine phosphoribosyltransferase
MDNNIVLSWQAVDEYISKIEGQIRESGFAPDYIVGIVRGGAIPAVLLSHRLGIPVVMVHWNTRDKGIDRRESNAWLSEDINFNNKKVLVVDDIVDTGLTIEELFEDWSDTKEVGAEPTLALDNIRVCAIIYNEVQHMYVDYYGLAINRNEDTRWCEFPWETK